MLTGAVLTGGASRRMGRNKALVPVEGTAMARRVADALLAAGCSAVTLVGGDESELAPLGLPVLADRHPGAGPLGGVSDALAAAPGELLVVACDLPYLTGPVLQDLVRAGADHPQADAVAARTDRLEPGCVLWRPSAAAVVSERFAAGERAVHRVLGLLDVVEVAVPTAALRNVNAPADLDR